MGRREVNSVGLSRGERADTFFRRELGYNLGYKGGKERSPVSIFVRGI